jgi:hypothetical protein
MSTSELTTEIMRLAAEVTKMAALIADLRAESAGLREYIEGAHREVERLADLAYPWQRRGISPDAQAQVWPDVVHPSDPADCPVCRRALGLPEPATLVLRPEIWCDVCGAWHIPTSCSVLPEPVDATGVPRTGPVAANGPGVAHGDPSDLQGIVDRIRDIKVALGDAPQVPLLDEWGRRHEGARPIGPVFTMPTADDAGEGEK